ncbi:hypothetical protein TWF281_006380 [Arthrobotrys megalospora]
MQHKVLATLLVLLYCRTVQGQLEWNDFTNNFATDLAPLITLFGEQVTKQFLSESLTIWDNIIFAMAPLGLLTAVVSVIRVCGSASLRAFIGRAQEGPGVAEIELLSCTSETTAEIYNEGGIARVFGEPQILEVVVVKPKDTGDPQSQSDAPRISMLWDAGFQGYHKAAYRQTLSNGAALDMNETKRVSRTHRPNLSLNAGIVRVPKWVTFLAAVIGVALQSGVLVFAALTVYVYPDSFATAGFGGDDRPAETYTFILTLVGTISVTFGLFLCAFIIERSSDEVRFSRNDSVDGKIYWIQPGGQKIGDQVFGSYIGSFSGPEYIVSTKSAHRNTPLLWLAVASSMFGFVAQFVGLRGMHASVTLAQIGSTMIMAIIRAALRTQRLDKSGDVISSLTVPGLDPNSPDQHPLIKDPKLVHGYELDLFTMQTHGVDGVFVSMDRESTFQRAIQTETEAKRDMGRVLLDARSLLAEYTGMPGVSRKLRKVLEPRETFLWDDLKVRDLAYKLQSSLEATFEVISKIRPVMTGSGLREEDDWSINLTTTDTLGRGLGGTYKVNLQFGKGASTAFKVPRGPQQLESVLGLWGLTLAGFDARQYHSHSFSAPGSRSWDSLRAVYVTELDDKDEAKAIERFWFPWIKGRWRLQHEEMTRKNLGYASKWSGLPGVEHHVYGMLSSPVEGHTLRVSFVHTDNSVLQMCGQDIFMLFLRAILRNVGSIGGKTSIRTGTNTTGLKFENTTVEALADAFEKAQLGSQDDAHMCIFTVLRDLKLMPGPKDLIAAVLADRHSDDIRQRLVEVEELLLSMLMYPAAAGCGKDEVLGALGELYVFAAEELNQDVSNFGFDGLVSFLQGNHTSQIVQEFGWIGLQLADRAGLSGYNDRLKKAGFDEQTVRSVSKLHGSKGLLALAECNNLRLMKYIPGTIDFDAQDDLGMTALSWAARNGNYKMAKWVLNNGVDAWVLDKDGRTAISYAAESGLHKVVKVIMDPSRISELNTPSIENHKTPLMFAAENGHALCIRHLLYPRNLDVNAVDKNGNNALMLAAAGGHVGVIGQLTTNDDTANKEGRTALHLASMKGFERAVDFLLIGLVGSGKTVDSADSNGHTALHLAAKGGHYATVNLLLTHGADRNLRDLAGHTPLSLSLQDGENYERVVRFLLSDILSGKCDLSLRTDEKKTALEEAKEKRLWKLRDMILAEEKKQQTR